jgi:Arc/MetJ family transcription regulator
MRTTLDIQEKILHDVLEATGASTKKKAVETALKEYIRFKHRQKLMQKIGNYDDFDFTLEELEASRNEP